MDYNNPTDSSGTDDDLPPPHQNRYGRNARGTSLLTASVPFPRMHNNDILLNEIHFIEQEAYYHVLHAFKAQSDALTWEKESLITELRKELRVSDEEHRQLLSRVDKDDSIRRIREWRKSKGMHSSGLSSSQPIHESIPSPTVSASRKKQKSVQSAGSLSGGAPPAMHHQSMQPPSAGLKRGPPTGGRGKKSKGMPYPPIAHSGRPLNANANANAGSTFGASEPTEAANFNPLVGRKVWTRWPDDSNFYEAVITDYNKEGEHALVYDKGTPSETWEWVELKNIPPEDIRWEGGDPGVIQRGKSGQGRGIKKPLNRGGAVGGTEKGRGTLKKDHLMPQNGIGRKGSADIELLHTDTLIKEVEKVFSGTHPDSNEVEKAKKILKEHEQALVEAIARLEDASDGESGEGDRPFPQEHMTSEEVGRRKRQYDEMRDKGRLATEKPLEL